MTQASYPFENADTTEAQYTALLRFIVPGGRSGVNGVPTGTTLKPFGDSSGMQVKVPAGSAIVRGHYYSSSAEETLTIAAASTNPRIDIVVLTLDPSANSIVLAVVQGTAASSPVAPTLTQTDTAVFQYPLAYVTVPALASTIASGDVSDKRTFITNAWTTANRPTGVTGLIGYNTTTGLTEVYTGSAWENVKDVSINASIITAGTLSSDRLPVVPISKGGTGAADAATALGNLGAAAAGHTHDASAITTGSLAVTNGGTGGTTRATAKAGIGVYVQSTAPSSPQSGDLWFW